MTRTEWQQVHAKLNALYPHQQIPPETAAVWFEDVSTFGQGEIWLAIRRHGRESRFAPALAEILAAIDANHRELGEARRAQARQVERLQQHPGVPMPPETREALNILAEMWRPDSGIDREQGLAMIESLADQLGERVPSAPDEPRLRAV